MQRATMKVVCGSNSAGRVRPCQGRCRRFESGLPLHSLFGTSFSRLRIASLRRLMLGFILWCILFVLCWPLALLALFLYPIVWLILLPFRIIGIAVGGVLELVWSIITLPARVIRRVA